MGTSPKILPSMRRKQTLLSFCQATQSLGPMWMFSGLSRFPVWDCTASVLEMRLDFRRLRSSMLRKSVLPPVLSW